MFTSQKNTMIGQSDGRQILTIALAVLIQYRLVTDGPTDRQTDIGRWLYALNATGVARKNRTSHSIQIQASNIAYTVASEPVEKWDGSTASAYPPLPPLPSPTLPSPLRIGDINVITRIDVLQKSAIDA